MDQRTESRTTDWEARPFPGGYGPLHELADADFSGAVVTDGGTWLFLLNGRAVGVFEGRIEDFESAEGTVFKAPDPSLPLLFTMLERGGEQQAKYYTNDTPISEAHQQLSDAQFTGYLELSENVVSGDYYVVYYGGRSMSCAFVGSGERLLTADEAFQQADDEVGIYEVRSVDIDVVDIPEPTGDAADAEDPGSAADEQGGTQAQESGSAESRESGVAGGQDPVTPSEQGEAAGQPADASSSGTGGGRADPAAGDQSAPAGEEPARERSAGADARELGADQPPADQAEGGTQEARQPAERQPDERPPAERQPGDRPPAERQPDDRPPAEGQPDDRPPAEGQPAERPHAEQEPAERAPTEREPADPTPDEQDAGRQAGGRAEPGESGTTETRDTTRQGPSGGGTSAATPSVEPQPKAAFDETTTIPSLAPARTGEDATVAGDTGGGSGGGTTGDQAVGSGSGTDASTTGRTGRRSPEEVTGGAVRSSGATSSPDVDVVDAAVGEDADPGELRSALSRRKERIEELEAHIADLKVQRDGLREDRDELRQEVRSLESEVEDLEAEIEGLRDRLDDEGGDGRRLGEDEALAGTNLFVRYQSKSGATLADAVAGDVDPEEVNGNLRLEHHTQFDADEVSVDGRSFDAFLEESIYVRYVRWLVRVLPYEIQVTGNEGALRDLYEAIPEIDRAELLGDVEVRYTEDDETFSEGRQFDVVLRDQMGDPLVVADVNDARNPATRGMMESVLQNANDVKESNDGLAAGMLVTASFFEPGALETAKEATVGGGLVGGSSKESFVKLSRKRGYHLLLVETRDDEFHVNVPEL